MLGAAQEMLEKLSGELTLTLTLTLTQVLGAAQEMLEKLSGERTRWDAMMGELNGQIGSMAANALLSAGFLVYLADEPEQTRAQYLQEWSASFIQAGLLPSSGPKVGEIGGFSMQTFLSTEGELLRWKGQGLPTDKLSSENAIVILNAHYTPLIIDPSSQAVEWLKTNLQANGGAIEVIVPHEPRFATALELGVRFGKTLVVQVALPETCICMCIPMCICRPSWCRQPCLRHAYACDQDDHSNVTGHMHMHMYREHTHTSPPYTYICTYITLAPSLTTTRIRPGMAGGGQP